MLANHTTVTFTLPANALEWAMMVGLLLFVFALLWLTFALHYFYKGFRKGQIGALSSTLIEYRLETNKDGTKEWRHSAGLNYAVKQQGIHYANFKRMVVRVDEVND